MIGLPPPLRGDDRPGPSHQLRAEGHGGRDLDAHGDAVGLPPALRGGDRPGPRRVRLGRVLSNTVLGLLVVVLVGLLAGTLLGYKAFTIRSGSMAPALGAGDVAVDRSVPPLSVHAGDIVTFRDPDFGGQLVTHRVVSVHGSGQQVHFVTKGDANLVAEHWSTLAGKDVGREVLTVPKVGFVLADVSTPLARASEVGLFSVCVAWIGLNRVWRRPRPFVAGRPVPQVAFR